MKTSSNTKMGQYQLYQDRAKRVVLLAFACVFAVLGVFLFAFNLGLNSRTQQVATQYVTSQPAADVLLIMSYDESDLNTPLARDGVLDLMGRSSVNVDVVYMDAYNAPMGSAAYDAWVTQIQQKVAQHGSYSAVICADDEALYFMEYNHDSMFPNTPVVFFGINDYNHATYAVTSGYMTGMVEQSYLASMMQATYALHPKATSFTVVVDETPAGLGNKAQFSQALVMLDGMSANYVNASKLSRAELGTILAGTSDDTILFLLDANNDRNGNVYTLDDTVNYVTNSSPSPVYRGTIGGVGSGIAGSSFLDPEYDGKRAAEITIRVLNGTRPADIPIVSDGTVGYLFDQEVLAKHNISTTSLPAGSTVLNRNFFSFETLQLILLPIALLVLAIISFVMFIRLGRRHLGVANARSMRKFQPVERHVDRHVQPVVPVEETVAYKDMQWLAQFAEGDTSADVRSIVEVDVLGISDIMDAHGRKTADEVLNCIGDRLEGTENVFIVRGEESEFIIGYSNEIQHNSQQLDFIKYVLKQPVKAADNAFELESRIGVANRQKGMSIDEMVSGVGYALRLAKDYGAPNTVVFFDNNMKHAMEDGPEITELLKKAIENEDFVLYYQPQIDLKGNDVAGYEALVHLRNNEYPPAQFIPVAEMSGLIVDIDRIVAKRAIEQLAKWKRRNKRLRPVSVNFSAAHLSGDGSFATFLLEQLRENEISPDYIKIEITEGLFNGSQEKAEQLLQQLIDAGITIALDKFGMGHTTFNDIMSVPSALVKIDKAFVDTFLVDGNDANFENLVRLAHGLGKKVIVVGVEKKWQLEICRELDCDIVQGYFFSKPLLPENAVLYKPR